MIAKVLVDRTVKNLNKVYDYIVPIDMQEDIKVGMRVEVNFGKGKGTDIEGIVVKLKKEKEDVDINKLKPLTAILDTESYLDGTRLKIGKWISKMYFCNVYEALKLMLPPGTSGTKKSKKLVGKQRKVVLLSKSIDEIEHDIFTEKITSPKQIKLLRFLEEYLEAELADIINNLGISRAIISTLEKHNYVEVITKEIIEENEEYIEKTKKLNPTSAQQTIIKDMNIKLEKNEYNVSLLHGVTGSGKTEVYLQIIEKCLSLNKGAIVLVPEIALTHQTKQRFKSRFGEIVSVLHSKMTLLERKVEWRKIKNNETKIVIGPRSALFAPISNLGLIIIDEEHDSSYTSFTRPKYVTRDVASFIANEYNACLMLGTATPDITTMYKAKTNKIDYYNLDKRPGAAKEPDIITVDMKEERLLGNHNLSNRLKEEIEENLKRKEQTFLFINRRGFSSYVTCKDCGVILKCINCDVNLTYHKKSKLLLCHYCSFTKNTVKECPKCNGKKLALGGTGTQNIEEKIKEVFPMAKIARMDMDTTIKRGSHEEILNDFKEGNADILIGTQMISKGHDIENVTLVGVINVDNTFAGNDFISNEKAFQNLLQVSGRAGRGSKKGRVILQAYDMDSYVLKCVENNSYEDFYEQEIEYRELLNYPPFTDLMLLELSSMDKILMMKECEKLYEIFKKNEITYKVYSPKAPFIQKISNKYRVQILLKLIISNESLKVVYENLSKYDKIKNKNVLLTVTNNPGYIG
ncbi:MAG: primosomal protein N' [Clostridia bacterium]|nr:primosomal protein N' [Clostridia bacterium]